MRNVLIDLFDYTGNTARPYREAGWEVWQVDKKLGSDIMDFSCTRVLLNGYKGIDKLIIIAMIPCTDYACSGSRHFKAKDQDGRTAESQKLVAKTKQIIDFFDGHGMVDAWMVENPMTRIHTLNPWLGKPTQKLDPWQVAGYDPNPDDSRYNKRTWLFGKFNIIPLKPLPPFEKDNPGWKNLGGKSERTKELRSITPLGLSYGFFHANN